MADRALPIIFLNLSGEMIYVIQQRLEAQNISKDKSSKVIWDIVNTMLNDQFIEELFKPQNMYSRSAMQSVFEKLVHSSIMRLNTTSMSKLYDLMLMVFKYQVVNCKYPEDIFLVTLNHMDAIKSCTAPHPELKKKFEHLHFLLISNYKDMTHFEYECLHDCIIVFLKDLNIRVSVLMRLGLQLPNGEIVGSDHSTLTRVDTQTEETLDKNTQEMWKKKLPKNYFELEGPRGISLGINIYTKSALLPEGKEKLLERDKKQYSNDNMKLEEITLLSRLIGNNCSQYVSEIPLSPYDGDLTEWNGQEKNCYVTIDASQVRKTDLSDISNEFVIKDEKKDKSDILELLDFAGNNKI